MNTYAACDECAYYAIARMPVVARHVAKRVKEDRHLLSAFYDRYMTGVHQRHLDGLPILPERAA